jgi:hypothetical protein
MSVIAATSAADLERYLSLRADDKAHPRRHEWWCLRSLLCHSTIRSKVEFPVAIEKSENPDFMVLSRGKRIMIEVTKATYQRFEQVQNLRKGMGGLLELDPSLYTDRLLKKRDGHAAWRRYVRLRGERLIGDGSVDGSQEASLAEAIETALRRKHRAGRTTDSKDEAWLLVDASDPFIEIAEHKVCNMIQHKIHAKLFHWDSVMIYFGRNETRSWHRLSAHHQQ